MRINRTIERLRITGCKIVNHPWVPSRNFSIEYYMVSNFHSKFHCGFRYKLAPDPTDRDENGPLWPNLQAVALSNAGLTSAPVRFLGAAAPRLQFLDVSGNKISSLTLEDFMALTHFGSIKELSLIHI